MNTYQENGTQGYNNDLIFDVYSACRETHDYASTVRHEERCKRERGGEERKENHLYVTPRSRPA